MLEPTVDQKIDSARNALLEAVIEKKVLESLQVILDSCTIQPAPHRIDLVSQDYHIVTVGIGRDHIATILISEEDMDALETLLNR